MKTKIKKTMLLSLLLATSSLQAQNVDEYDFWGSDNSTATIIGSMSSAFSTSVGSPFSGSMSGLFITCFGATGMKNNRAPLDEFFSELTECMVSAPVELSSDFIEFAFSIGASTSNALIGSTEGVLKGIKSYFGYNQATQIVREETLEQLAAVAVGNENEGEIASSLVDMYLSQDQEEMSRSEAAIKIMGEI